MNRLLWALFDGQAFLRRVRQRRADRTLIEVLRFRSLILIAVLCGVLTGLLFR